MQPQTKKQYLKRLVSEKNDWSRPLTDEERKLGFLGWHERGYLPHCDFPNLVQYVTFRLSDSMPSSRRAEWEYLLKIEDGKDRRSKLEEYLDRGVGNCELRDPRIAQVTEDALLHFHQQRYELLAWCIMPNHVHVLHHISSTPLWKIIQGWKIHATIRLRRQRRNAELPLGQFWQREYWDTFMRDEEQQRKAIKYIEANPTKAKLCRSPENWPFSSARFRDKFHRLNIPSKETHDR